MRLTHKDLYAIYTTLLVYCFDRDLKMPYTVSVIFNDIIPFEPELWDLEIITPKVIKGALCRSVSELDHDDWISLPSRTPDGNGIYFVPSRVDLIKVDS